MSQKILKFKATSGFGKWKKYFPKSAVSHPAKINLNLLEYLILNYTKEGDTVLDCMCGTGSTVVLSMLKNRNAIGVDLEEKFTNWAKRAIKNVEQQQTLTPKGKGMVICGDSRKLSELLKEHEEEISSVIFSPPYKTANKGGGLNKNPPKTFRGVLRNHSFKLSDNPSNIDNLPFADVVTFSPPYSTAGAKGDENPENYIRRAKERHKLMKQQGINRPETEPGRYSGGWNNIGNLPFGIDCIVTSPPYAASLCHRGQKFKDVRDKLLSQGYSEEYIRASWSQPHQCQRWAEEAYSESDENIGNFQYDTIISSPSYSDRSEHRVGYDYQARDIERGYKPYHGFREQYEDNPENIGSLKFCAILFSPPYSLGHDSGDNASEEYGIRLEEQRKHTRVYSNGNISKLSFISAILFSPPYSNIETSQQTSKSEIERRIEKGIQGSVITEEGKYMTGWGKRQEKYSSNLHNIANIKDFGVDAVLASPPYEDSVTPSNAEKESVKAKELGLGREGGWGTPGGAENVKKGYSNNKENIGNKKKENYLEAMKTVYEQCFLVLKPQGLLILILKNFIRDKKVVKLTDHTIRLCEGVGFKLKERLLFRLPTQSFWRRLYSQKYPEVDTSDLRYEHILIFEKKEQSGKNK